VGLKDRQEDKNTKSTLTSDMSNTQKVKDPNLTQLGNNGLFHPEKNSQMDKTQPIKPNSLFGNPLNDKKLEQSKNNLGELTKPSKKPIDVIKKPIEKKLVDKKIQAIKKPIVKKPKPKPILKTKPVKKTLLDFPRPVIKGFGRSLEQSLHTTSTGEMFGGHSELDTVEGQDVNDLLGGKKLRTETFSKIQQKQIKNVGKISGLGKGAPTDLRNLSKGKTKKPSIENSPTPTLDGYSVGEKDLGKEGIGLTFTGQPNTDFTAGNNNLFSDVRPNKSSLGQNNLSSNIQPQTSIYGKNNLSSNIQPQKSILGQNNLSSDVVPKKVDMMGKNNLFGNKLNGR
tara:strand:+ start:532 stop:1548 length:1017 start_codon:yes stop_codon:yes gene_type:complete